MQSPPFRHTSEAHAEGVTLIAAEAGPAPDVLEAETVQLYVVPLASGDTTIDVLPLVMLTVCSGDPPVQVAV